MKNKPNSKRIFSHARTQLVNASPDSAKKRWKLLVLGFIAGVITTLCIQKLFEKSNPEASDTVAKNTKVVEKSTIVKQEDNIPFSVKPDSKKPVFDFYTQLAKNRETYSSLSLSDAKGSVAVSKDEKLLQNSHKDRENVQRSVRKPIGQSSPANTKKSSSGSFSYMVQAASLKTSESAEKLKESIKKWGLHCSIKSVRGKKGLWYRVQAGPFFDIESAREAKSLLALHGLKGLLIKL